MTSSSSPTDWHEYELGELLSLSNGINADKSAYGRGTPFINVLEVITNESLTVSDIPGRVTLPNQVLARYRVNRADVLFNRTSETQEEVGLTAVYLDGEPVVFGGFVFRGRPTTADLELAYSKYALRATDVRNQIIARGQGGIRANIGQRDLKSVVIRLPGKPEQRAIAEAIDDATAIIGSLKRLIVKQQAIKQGVMQQLLTGRTRLPGFTDEWRQSTIGAEFDVQLGKMLDAAKNTGVVKPYLGNRAVQWGRIDVSAAGSVPMTPSDIHRYRLRAGDLLVCEGGEVGRAAVWRNELPECYFQKALHRLRAKDGYDIRVMGALLEFWSSVGFFADYVTQTSIAHLPREKLVEMPLPLPSIVEQTAMGDLVEDLDRQIACLERRVVKQRAIKQGMTQQLLTGRVRLRVEAAS